MFFLFLSILFTLWYTFIVYLIDVLICGIHLPHWGKENLFYFADFTDFTGFKSKYTCVRLCSSNKKFNFDLPEKKSEK